MKKIDTDEFETLLRTMKADIESNIARIKAEQEGVTSDDAIDDPMGAAALQSTNLHEIALLEQQQHELNEVNRALAKIENGTYGLCEASGEPIPLKRLRVLPHTRYSIEEQQRREA